MSKHTPGAVAVDHRKTAYGPLLKLVAEDGDTVAVIPCDDTIGRRDGRIIETHSRIAVANAKRLALAWNCHDELADVAKRLEAYLASQGWRDDADAPESELLRDARAALRKAGVLL